MIQKLISRHLLFILPLLTLTSACGGLALKGDKPSPDWSRSVALGEDSVGSLGISVDDTGHGIRLVWPTEEKGERALQFVGLNEEADIIASETLSYPGHVRSPRLVKAAPGRLHLFWITRKEGNRNWELWHTLLHERGLPEDPSQRLTKDDENVGRYEVASDGEGGALLIWDMGENDGLRALRLDSHGEISAGPVQLVGSGRSPSLRVDAVGRGHLAWLDDRSFYYLELRTEDLSTSEITEVVDLDRWGTLNTSGDSLDGPSLGYAGGWIYVLWSIVSLTDTEAGTGVAEYVSFREGSPSNLQPSRLWSIPAEDQPYVPHESSLALTHLSQPLHIVEAAERYGVTVQFENPIAGDWVDVSGAVSDYMLSPSTMIGNHDDLAVAMAVSQEQGSDEDLQIATAVFSDGQYVGYNFAGKTSYLSNDPMLAVDDNGELYVAWREGAKGETIHFATTAKASKARLDRLVVSDLAMAAPQGLTQGLSAIAFAPFVAFCWIMPGLLLLGGWQLVREQPSLKHRMNWMPLLISLALYYGLKVSFLPSFTSYVPFSAWLYIPQAFSQTLMIGVPLLILGLSALVATIARRRLGDSMLIFFFSWTAVDGLLTLVVYGVNFLGIF